MSGSSNYIDAIFLTSLIFVYFRTEIRLSIRAASLGTYMDEASD